MSCVYILNGPNLDQLGQRTPELYGHMTLEQIKNDCVNLAENSGAQVVFRQTNHEGQLIEWVHEARDHATALIINAAGLTHTSVSLLDALLMLKIPIYEVHLSQIYRRESYRRHSYVSEVAAGVITGFGAAGYTMALGAALTQRS